MGGPTRKPLPLHGRNGFYGRLIAGADAFSPKYSTGHLTGSAAQPKMGRLPNSIVKVSLGRTPSLLRSTTRSSDRPMVSKCESL